ncbi:HD-GYP domain-containing protein [Clostridiaceae bacterium HSG29]|nr:HD-GYP domain-containing protein [Clostridiaceae bacterium HSG29]
MKSIYLNDIVPGMHLAKSIYSLNGDLLLEKGIEINERIINSIKNAGISAVFIYTENGYDIHTKLETIDIMYKHFDESINTESFSKRKGVLSDDAYAEIKDVIFKIFDIIKSNDKLLMNINKIMEKDFYTYEHSLNVAVLSILIALRIGCEKEIVINVGVGALLHDIGKILITDEILNKPGKLTDEEFEIIKKHSIYGYEFVKDSDCLSQLSKDIILYHHERLDGSGYPTGVKTNTLENGKYINIVSFTDVFDAMTNDRVYKKKMPLYMALEFVSSQVPDVLDIDVLETMINHITPFPPGTYVQLTTGEKGFVVSNNFENPTRPIIKVVYDCDGIRIFDDAYIDLMKKLTTFVQDTLIFKE